MATGLWWVKDPSELVPRITDRGVAYYPLWQLIPALEPLYTPYEKEYNAGNGFKLIRDNKWFPLAISTAYLLFIVIGQRVMKNRKPFDLKGALAGWNLALALFSIMGAFRIISHVVYLLLPKPYGAGFTMRDTHCIHPEGVYADGATGLWAFLFTTSKCVELIDTVFVVLRKKPLIFLHWYHHLTVLLCAWFGHAAESPALWYMAMNYTVHGVMYFYFFMAAVNKVPKWFKPHWITVVQIAQMFFGTYVVGMSAYHHWYESEACAVDDKALLYLCAMYLSYMYLFIHFFVSKYAVRAVKVAKQALTPRSPKPTAEATKPAKQD